MPEQTPNKWPSLGDSLANALPSSTYRSATAEVLSRVARLGPLGDSEAEFRRVYRFLHYNEAARLLQVIDELLKAHEERKDHLEIKNNAWKYVVRAFDSWIGRARIFYLAAGIVEGSLRSRLDAHLTEVFGIDWHKNREAVPSNVRDQASKEDQSQKLGSIRRILEDLGAESGTPEEKATALEAIRTLIAAQEVELPGQTGSEFCSRLQFSSLRSFFQAKRLWSNIGLGKLFKPLHGDTPPLKSEVDTALQTIHEVRNEVAHYRPSGKLSFLEGLFAVAKLARWLDVDLQHFYSSVDSKMTTELSLLLESHYPPAFTTVRSRTPNCLADTCPVGGPFDLLLKQAPIAWPSNEILGGATLACLYHRVQSRATEHKDAWPSRERDQ